MWSHQSTLFYLFILLFFTVWWYLPVTEQNVRTVHLEGARQMDKSLWWNSNLLIAREFRRLPKNALRELSGSNKPPHKTKVSTVKCSYVEGEHAGQSSEDSWVHLVFFSLPWLPHAEGQQTKTEKTWLAKAKLLPACHVGLFGWKENKQTIKQSWVFPQFEIEKYRSWKIHHGF